MFDYTQSQKFLGLFEKLVKALGPQAIPYSERRLLQMQDRQDATEDLALWRSSALALMSGEPPTAEALADYCDDIVAEHHVRRVKERENNDKEY